MNFVEFLGFVITLVALSILFFRQRKEKRETVFEEEEEEEKVVIKPLLPKALPSQQKIVSIPKIEAEVVTKIEEKKPISRGKKLFQNLNSKKDVIIATEILKRSKGWE